MEFLSKAGILIYPLGLASLVASTVTIERLFALRRSRVLPKEIIEVVESVQAGKDVSLAIEVCRRNPGVFSDVMRVGLELAGEPWEVMSVSFDSLGLQIDAENRFQTSCFKSEGESSRAAEEVCNEKIVLLRPAKPQ